MGKGDGRAGKLPAPEPPHRSPHSALHNPGGIALPKQLVYEPQQLVTAVGVMSAAVGK